jgi:hypothetical protein
MITLDKLPYRRRLLQFRNRTKLIDGIPLVPRRMVIAIFTKIEIKNFERKYKWYKDYKWCICPTCKTRHLNKHKFVRYANFWQLEEFVRRREE